MKNYCGELHLRLVVWRPSGGSFMCTCFLQLYDLYTSMRNLVLDLKAIYGVLVLCLYIDEQAPSSINEHQLIN